MTNQHLKLFLTIQIPKKLATEKIPVHSSEQCKKKYDSLKKDHYKKALDTIAAATAKNKNDGIRKVPYEQSLRKHFD